MRRPCNQTGLPMPPLSDLDVYRNLSGMAEQLERMEDEAASLVSQTALQTAAMTLRGVASAIYSHCLSDDDGAA